jgi:hypothetical protein
MNHSRLIIVEGIPGSGKTSTATFIQKWLDERGFSNRLYLEGNLDHPADYEGVAYFSRPEYDQFLTDREACRHFIELFSSFNGDDCFVAYRKLEQAHKDTLPEGLIDELARRDVYEVPTADLYCRLTLDRWKAFTEAALQAETIYVFECCFLQNPLTMLVAKYNAPASDSIRLIQTMLEIVKPLNPILVYLYQKNTRSALEKIVAQRERWWHDALIAYVEKGMWSKTTGTRGFDAVVGFYERSKALTFYMLERFNGARLLIENKDYNWEKCEREIAEFLAGQVLPE